MNTWIQKLITLFESKKEQDFIWGLVGNIKKEIPYGEAGIEIQQGTRHFSPGTKVYCFPALWGDGYEKIKVIGKHRGAKRLVCMIIPSKSITNWRKQKIYSPTIIKLIKKNGARFWESEKEIDKYFQESAF